MGVAEAEYGDVPEGDVEADSFELTDPSSIDVGNDEKKEEDDTGTCRIQENGDVPVGVGAYIPGGPPVDGNLRI